MNTQNFEQTIFGSNQATDIVALEPDGDNGTASIFRRTANGLTEETQQLFIPWLLTNSDIETNGSVSHVLTGDGYNRRIDFHKSKWRGFVETRRQLLDSGAKVLSYTSQSRQFLCSSGITLFKGMSFENLRRMQIDIETTSLFPQDPKARILLCAISDNSGRVEVLDGDETEILEELGDRVRRWDPDVIEGHNIFGFDLPYILHRSKVLGVVLAIGRNPEKLPTIGNPRNCAIGANSRPFTPIYVYGRHVIDTYLQVQRFDAPRGQISSYGLKECAKVYGLMSANRVDVDRSKMDHHLRQDPERVKLYAQQDVEETRALAALVTPTDFYQSQIIPDVYQSVAVTGNGEKVNSLLVRDYLTAGHAIPFSTPSRQYPGGYTEIRRVGVINKVVKADVESLYPSIMLSQNIKPVGDTRGIFLPLLEELTERRLNAKKKLQFIEQSTTEYAYWDGLQSSYKTLINSFYGYIGGPFYFNDYSAARTVTSVGQKIVKNIAEELERSGSSVIEIDTDGIYFEPPHSVNGKDDEQKYIDEVAKILPDGIRLAHDGRYAAMLSLKIKNYVLVEYNGRKIMKGSSLRSRSDEKFGRTFLGQAVDFLLSESYEELSKLYGNLLLAIQDGKLASEDFSRRERITATVKDSPQRSEISSFIRNGDISDGDIIQVYNRHNGSIGLESSFNHDEDRDYYADKLYRFALRLFDAIGPEKFNLLFPKPKSMNERLQDRLQSSFDF